MTKNSQNCNLRRKVGKLLKFRKKEDKTVETKADFFAFPGVSNLEEQNLVTLPVVGQLSPKALARLW